MRNFPSGNVAVENIYNIYKNIQIHSDYFCLDIRKIILFTQKSQIINWISYN